MEHAGISPASWSLFGQVWPSATILADLMQTWDLQADRVLEVGCGLALASLVIHRRLGNVTATDGHPLAESFLHDNLLRNLLPPMKYATCHWGRQYPDLGLFDLIIGSDVLYERDHPQQLAEFIDCHAAEKVVVIIIDPNRSNHKCFSQRLLHIGFILTEQKIHTIADDGTHYRGRMLKYQRIAGCSQS